MQTYQSLKKTMELFARLYTTMQGYDICSIMQELDIVMEGKENIFFIIINEIVQNTMQNYGLPWRIM